MADPTKTRATADERLHAHSKRKILRPGVPMQRHRRDTEFLDLAKGLAVLDVLIDRLGDPPVVLTEQRQDADPLGRHLGFIPYA